MRTAEGGEEVVEGNPVCDIDSSQLKADLVLIPVEKVVMTHGKIEDMAWGNPGGVVIGIIGSGRCDRYQRRSVLRSWAETIGAN